MRRRGLALGGVLQGQPGAQRQAGAQGAAALQDVLHRRAMALRGGGGHGGGACLRVCATGGAGPMPPRHPQHHQDLLPPAAGLHAGRLHGRRLGRSSGRAGRGDGDGLLGARGAGCAAVHAPRAPADQAVAAQHRGGGGAAARGAAGADGAHGCALPRGGGRPDLVLPRRAAERHPLRLLELPGQHPARQDSGAAAGDGLTS
mmetsp:Transcript_2581/g.6470  ORF Transcript_2581/g.6470 Transcript_2581/m.6470 type:complete len:202 (-) Transcript_2581:194-799(-)